MWVYTARNLASCRSSFAMGVEVALMNITADAPAGTMARRAWSRYAACPSQCGPATCQEVSSQVYARGSRSGAIRARQYRFRCDHRCAIMRVSGPAVRVWEIRCAELPEPTMLPVVR